MDELLTTLHTLFITVVQQNPMMLSWKKQNLNTSEPFYQKAESLIPDLLQYKGEIDFIPMLHKRIYDLRLHQHTYMFIGGIASCCAAQSLADGDAPSAQKFAEAALAYSQFDLFAQDTLLRANHVIDPSTRSVEDTDAWLKTRFCPIPFTTVETTTSGEMYRCCPSYLPLPIGTIDDRGGMETILNSPASESIKQSIIDGNFKYCSRLQCPAIGNRTLISREEGLEKLKTLSPYPDYVTFSHDPSCNLSCPSCRKEKIVIPKAEQEKFDGLTERTLLPLMKNAGKVRICGSGDPFASIHFRNLLVTYCQSAPADSHSLILETNGVLCDAKAWETIGLYGHVHEVMISMDAALPETYAVLRRDGDYTRLLENLSFLKELRAKGEFQHFSIRFVVQARNYKEMPAFVALGQKMGVDHVQFSQIRNWGTFEPAAFTAENILSRAHPEHETFLAMLKDPLFDLPIVELGNLNNFRQSDG